MKLGIKHLYLLGSFCFAVVAIMSLWGMILRWDMITFPEIASSIAGFVINLIFSFIFMNLYKSMNVEVSEEFASEDINEVIKKIQDSNNTTKKEGTKNGRDKQANT